MEEKNFYYSPKQKTKLGSESEKPHDDTKSEATEEIKTNFGGSTSSIETTDNQKIKMLIEEYAKKLELTPDSLNEIVIQSQLYEKFNTDPSFTKLTKEFMQKLATNFVSKGIAKNEWTSFVNTVHNLYTQHVGKSFNRNKDFGFNKETKEDYFLDILDYIYKEKFFEGEIFELWRKNGWRTLEEMNNFSMVTVNKDKLKEEYKSTGIISLKKLSDDNSNSSIGKYFGQVFNAVLKILKKQNFRQPSDCRIMKKPNYLNKIQHLLTQYTKSKEWSEELSDLIKLDKKLNFDVYNLLVEKKLISDKNNFVELNQTEIENLSL